MRFVGVLPAFRILRVCNHRRYTVGVNIKQRIHITLSAQLLILTVPLVLPVGVLHLIHSLVNWLVLMVALSVAERGRLRIRFRMLAGN